MKKFVVIVQGDNVIVGKKMCGFYTTRFVEANSEAEAIRNAFDLVCNEIKSRPDKANDRFGLPEMSIYEINEVDGFGDNSPPGKGFTYYEYEEGEGN